MSKTPYPVDPVQTGIALAYRNKRFIAGDVLPLLPPIDKEEFKYQLFDMKSAFTSPDTKVGRKSEPNEVEFKATEKLESTQDYGLDEVIPVKDLAQVSFNKLGQSTEFLTNLIDGGREKRVAAIVHSAATYPAGNKVTLSGTDQWDDALSDPVVDISDGMDTPIMRPNIGVIGRRAFTVLRRNAQIVKAIHGNSGDSGLASLQAIADLFELEALFVGEAWVNLAQRGQAANMNRIWGNHMALLHINRSIIDPQGAPPTFGFSVPYLTRFSGQIPEPKKGLRGSIRNRVGESMAEVVSAADVGYFIENVI